MFEEHGDDGPEHAEVVEPCRVGRRVIGEEEPEEGEDQVLESESDPIYDAPGDEVSDDSREDARDKDAEEEARDDD